MSLNFNGWGEWRGESNDFWDENDQMRPEVESVIFSTMAVGINKITPENVEEFWKRLRFMYHLSYKQEPYVSREFLDKMIGLSTNASTMTHNQFIKYRTDLFWKDGV